jgi:ribosome-associated protein
MPEEFKLEGSDFIELNKLLKITGLCESGGRAKILIDEGRVKVDGKVELRKRCKIRCGQEVELEGQSVLVK